MNRIKTLITLLLCISMIFSSISVSFAHPEEEFNGEETVITNESMEEQGELGNRDKEDDISYEETSTDGEEIIEGDENSVVTDKEDNDINPDESLSEDESVDTEEVGDINNEEGFTGTQGRMGMGTFSIGDTVTYYVEYVYVLTDLGTGYDEHIVLQRDTYNDLVVGEEYTFYPIEIEGYKRSDMIGRTVVISESSETIEFLNYRKLPINIIIHYEDSEGNTIKESDTYIFYDIGSAKVEPPEIEGYPTPDVSYIEIDHTTVNDVEYTLVYKEPEVEPDNQFTITIHYQDSEGNTIKESDIYQEDNNLPNEYYAPEIEGYIKPEDDKFIRGVADEGVTHFEHIFIYTKELVYDPNEVIYMPDEGLRAILGYDKDAIITRGQMAERKIIDFQNYMYGIPIYDYTGLEYAVNVEKIRVNSSVLYDSSNFFETIQSLENVTEFESDFNMSESDLSNLVNIKSLETISLKFAGLGDIDFSPLERLSNLKYLDLSNNNITNVSSLVNITQLEELNLMNNGIVSLEGLENLINLKQINVAFNRIDFNIEPNKAIKEHFINKGLFSESVNSTQSPARRAIVTVNHIDDNGEVIKEPTVVDMFGDLIKIHDLIELIEDIEGYRLTGTPNNQNVLYYGQAFNLNFVYEKEALPAGTVYIYYLDEDWNEIRIGDTYDSVSGTQTYYAPDIEGYTKPDEDSITFTVVEGQYSYQHFFFYSKEEVKEPTATVYIHYQDEEGNTLKSSDIYYNVKGTDNYYYAGGVYIEGYNTPAPPEDYIQIVVTEGITEYHHTFIYKRLKIDPKGQVNIKYVDEDGNELKEMDSYFDVTGTQTYYASDIDGYIKPEKDLVTVTIKEDQNIYNYTFVYQVDDSGQVEPVEPPESTEPEKPTEPIEPDKPKEEPKEEEPTPEEPKEEEPTPEEPKEEKPTEPEKPKEEETKPVEPKEEPNEEETAQEEQEEEPKDEVKEPTEPKIEEPEVEEQTPEIPKEEPKIEESKGEIKETYKPVEDIKEVEKTTEPNVEEPESVEPEIEEHEMEEPIVVEEEPIEPIEPTKPEEKEVLPVIPVAVGAAGGLIILFFYFKKRKNLKIYAVEEFEDNEIKRLLGKKNLKVHSDEIIIDLKRELEMLIDENILRLYFNRSLSVKLQDKKIIFMNGNDKVYEIVIEEYVTTMDIEI